MPRNSLIDFTEEELELINECRENGDFENPLYKEYKETEKQSHIENVAFLKSLGACKENNTLITPEEDEKMIQEMLDYEF